MTAGAPLVCSVIIGPDEHGVVRHAGGVARSTEVAVVRSIEVPPVLPTVAVDAAVVHLHFTDRLFGPDAASAGRAFGALADGLPGRRVVTLHDVPEPTGTAHALRRIDAYLHVVRRADALVVCSDHERRRLRAIGISTDTTVIPLPVATPVPAACRSAGEGGRSVGVLGFIYPGKGHDAVLAAVATLPDDVTVEALGQVSVGHEDLLGDLQETARRTGRRLSVSGFVGDEALAVALQTVAVPVVPAATTSASSSLCSWIAAGRRPLAAANGFTGEIAAMAPDLLTLYRPGSAEVLGEAIARALAEPASTWHGGAIPVPLRAASVAARHLALYGRLTGDR